MEDLTQKEFNKTILVHWSNKTDDGFITVNFSPVLAENTYGMPQTKKVFDYGGAKKSLYEEMVGEE